MRKIHTNSRIDFMPLIPRRLVLSIVGLAAVGSLAACQAPVADQEGETEVARNVRVLELAPETLTEYFEISGPVSPVLGTDLSLEESGPVVQLPLEKGMPVHRGDLLVEIDRTILQAEKASAVAQFKTQEFNYDKVRQLHDAGKVSEIDLLTSQAQFEQARSLARIAERRYERAGLTAPFDGVLTDRYVELGQLVVPGQSAVRLIDPHQLKLEAHLTATEVGFVRRGEKARVQLGQIEEEIDGTVSWVGLEADRMTGKFRVEIEIPNGDLALSAGVIGRARLPKQTLEGAVIIPRDAVLPGREGFTAFVVEGDRARSRVLDLGPDQGALVLVRSGLQAGDLLVVRGHRELRDGSLVKITETSTAADGSISGDPGTVRSAAEVAR